jgi:hypothetical protein
MMHVWVRGGIGAWLAVLVGWGIWAAACGGKTSNPSGDGGISASSDADNEADVPNPRCRACLGAANDPGPGCAAELMSCDPPRCSAIFECAYAAGCYFMPTINESVQCQLPCVGPIIGTDDPAIVPLVQLVMCAYGKCAEACTGNPTR